MSLFDEPGRVEPPASEPTSEAAPLADRMRPRDLSEVVGQSHLLGEKGFLSRAIAGDRVPSLIFWGPAGCGKTTLARIIARSTSARFVPFSAVTSGIKEIKAVMAEASLRRRQRGTATLLFVDEIHRFHKGQQDAFLPWIEQGDIVLVGATTENPSFALNAALLSRCRVLLLEPLAAEDLELLLARALGDEARGLGRLGVRVGEEGLAEIAQLASGDARRALGLLELVASDAAESGLWEVSAARVGEVAQRKTLVYDRSGEEHFNLVSALHKSLRESHPDAALYWLERMLVAGEDPRYVARRLLRFASEDVGLADPDAVGRTLAAWQAWERLGSPEGDLALAQAAIDLALCPKSNAVYRAAKEARRAIEELPAEPVPLDLRNAPTRLMKEAGYGRDYAYAPDTPEGVAGLDCLPPALAGRTFYRPRGLGREARLAERLQEFSARRARARGRRQGRADREPSGPAGAGGEG